MGPHRLKLLIHLEHEHGYLRPLNIFERLRLRAAKRAIDRARGLRTLGLELAHEKSLMTMVKDRFGTLSRRPLDDRMRAGLARVVAEWVALNEEPLEYGHETPHVVDWLARVKTMGQFESAVATGRFGMFEALRHHAESKGIKVVPLDDRQLRVKALQGLSEAEELGRAFFHAWRTGGLQEWQAKKRRMFQPFLKSTVHDRNEHMIEAIRRTGADGAGVGSTHAEAIAQRFPVDLEIVVDSWPGRMTKKIYKWWRAKRGF